MTIALSVSIIAAPGVYASISVMSLNGVRVAGVGIRVRLSGLTINGLGGDIGITSSKVRGSPSITNSAPI